MYKWKLFLFIIIFSCSIHSQTLPNSAMQAASSNIIFLYDEPVATFLNPASNHTGFQSSVANFYKIDDLNMYSLIFSKNVFNFTSSIGLKSIGYDSYRENQISVITSYNFGFLQFGLSENLINTKISNYQNDNKFITDIGFIIKKDRIFTGLSYKNIFRYDKDNEAYPIIFNWENGYKINDNIRLGFIIEKESHFDFTSAIGSSYNYQNIFTITNSYQLEPERFSFGICFKIKSLEISYAIKTHQYLNLSHFVSLKLL